MLNQGERIEEHDQRNPIQNVCQQQLPFFDLPSDKKVLIPVRPVKPHGERYLQDCLWKESLLAIKVSLETAIQQGEKTVARYQFTPFSDYDGPAQFGDDTKDLEDLVSAFRTFLLKQIEAARKAHPGKTVRLNLKAG